MSELKENVTRVLTGLRADRCSALYFGGRGSILMFHRVVADSQASRLQNEAIEVSPAYLEMMVGYLQAEYDIVPLGEVPDRLRGRGGRRFVALTFDDGYLDNFTLAYPLLKRHGAPFTVYVCTSYPDKSAAIWPYALEDLLLGREEISLSWLGSRKVWSARSVQQRRAAFESIWDVIFGTAPSEWGALWTELFEKNGIDLSHYARTMTMDWEHIRLLAADPLATIGAHTISHFPLARLPEDRMFAEIRDSKRQIEERLGKPVEHFAYPFGSPGAAGPREFAAAARAGFKTATTTRRGNLFPQHLEHLHALPRVDSGRTRPDLAFIKSQLSGLRGLMTGQLERVVTA